MARATTKASEARKDEPRKGRPRVSSSGRRGKVTVEAPRSAKPQGLRAERQAQRREAILAAALDEFSARGFAAARLDDVAKRAGVAKGTIYLYFHDKESLFQELVRSMLSPVVGGLIQVSHADIPIRQF